MNIWTFKRSICVMAIALAGCSGGDAAFSLFDSGTELINPRRNVALEQADMMGGNLTLVPPQGYCVDKNALESSFALIARCDSLGGRPPLVGPPLGMIAVSVTEVGPEIDLAETIEALVPNEAEILSERNRHQIALRHLNGPTPEASDPKHWRALAQIGPYVLSLTAYAPLNGKLAGPVGARVLTSLAGRSARASARSDDN